MGRWGRGQQLNTVYVLSVKDIYVCALRRLTLIQPSHINTITTSVRMPHTYTPFPITIGALCGVWRAGVGKNHQGARKWAQPGVWLREGS